MLCLHHHVQMSLGCFVHGTRVASCQLFKGRASIHFRCGELPPQMRLPCRAATALTLHQPSSWPNYWQLACPSIKAICSSEPGTSVKRAKAFGPSLQPFSRCPPMCFTLMTALEHTLSVGQWSAISVKTVGLCSNGTHRQVYQVVMKQWIENRTRML